MAARILLVDDHPIVREGIRRLIDKAPDMTCCGEAEDGPEALSLLAETRPDVVIVDLALPSGSGMELMQRIHQQHASLPVLILSMYSEDAYAERMLRAGASGYVMKQEAPRSIITALRQVLDGKIYVSPNISAQILQSLQGGRLDQDEVGLDRLSDRELQIYRLIGEGGTNQEIADALSLSVKTIESHVERLKNKLALGSGRALLRHATAFVMQARGPQPPL